jgi:23S rRNA (guanosine2251-2'-O)-methyltransferase
LAAQKTENHVGQNPRSRQQRTHRHADFSAKIMVGNEDRLFGILEKLQVPPFLLILDCVQDPHNLGACLRSANAAGVHAVITPKDRSVSVTDVVVRVACGAAEKTPLVHVTNLARTMKELKEKGLWIVGTHLGVAKSVFDCKLTGPLALVVGSEGEGIRRLTAETCDDLVSIPMLGEVQSLNVSVAAGVCLFEAVRQRSQS